jgi:deoxyhypusine synthase
MSKYKQFDITDQKKYKMSDRLSKVNIQNFTKIDKTDISGFLDLIPKILKGRELNELLDLTHTAYLNKKPILIGIGGHVIKTGMSPLLNEMINLNAIQGICANGSVIIHDFEIAVFGQTSEDVAEALEDGTFGMASDTCDTINEIITGASAKKLGYGEAVGKYLSETDILYPDLSVVRNAYLKNVPTTVHVAMGTDIVHQHNTANGAAIGDCTLRDFYIFTDLVSKLGDGGVFICFGSSVIIPEVFLKALSVCRNKGISVKNFTTAVFDMNYHYRPNVNVAMRPVQKHGKGYYFIGHHEIMIPLFLFALRERIL